MKADPRFTSTSSDFWANVRTISEKLGYVKRAYRERPREIKEFKLTDMRTAMSRSGLGTDHLIDPDNGEPTALAKELEAYFSYRAEVLNDYVQPRLMCRRCAEREFEKLKSSIRSIRAVPMNKQSGTKKKPAYLTGMVNLLIESNVGVRPCNYNPNQLTAFTSNGMPLKTLSRRHDGGFPDVIDPIVVWEIKEYYHTTTFGSKISDGVYITQLDGLEIEEARDVGVDVRLVLMVDAYFTWWNKGLSYLCRLVDLLNMGYVDEILFGSEVIERLPNMVVQWNSAFDARTELPTPPAPAATPPSGVDPE